VLPLRIERLHIPHLGFTFLNHGRKFRLSSIKLGLGVDFEDICLLVGVLLLGLSSSFGPVDVLDDLSLDLGLDSGFVSLDGSYQHGFLLLSFSSDYLLRGLCHLHRLLLLSGGSGDGLLELCEVPLVVSLLVCEALVLIILQMQLLVLLIFDVVSQLELHLGLLLQGLSHLLRKPHLRHTAAIKVDSKG